MLINPHQQRQQRSLRQLLLKIKPRSPSKQHLDEDEFIDLGAYTMEELKEKIYSGEIEDAKTVSALLAYEVKYCK